MHAIIVAGPLGAGKDYVTDQVAGALRAREIDVDVLALGDYYYSVVGRRYGLNVAQVRAQKPRFRSELQEVGGDVAAQANALAYMESLVANIRDEGRVAIVTARKPLEVAQLRTRLDAFAIAVDAPLADRIQRVRERDGVAPTENEVRHAVEVEAHDLPADLVIPNGVTAGELKVAVMGPVRAPALVFSNAHLHHIARLGHYRPAIRLAV